MEPNSPSIFRTDGDEFSSNAITCARFEVLSNSHLSVGESVRVSASFRRAVMAVCSSSGILPSEISGHDGPFPAKGHRHAYFLPEDDDGEGGCGAVIRWRSGSRIREFGHRESFR